jgi:glycosyltransferase involved in cell wall biosynthesis
MDRSRPGDNSAGADDASQVAPLVSVIIPTHNHARFLGEAIESVLEQTAQNLEVVVVDDGSTDHAAEVVARYPRARYVHQHHQGLAAARNTGIRHSSGRYLVFLDADDRLMPRAIESGVTCLDAHPGAAFVSGLHRFVTADGVPTSTSPRDPVGGDHYLAFLRGNYVGMHATVLYRRQTLTAAGGFNTQLRACEDYDLYLRLSRQFRVATHDELVAEYRMHGSNMSGDLPLMLESVIQTLTLQRGHLGDDPARHAAYRAGLKAWREHYTGIMLRRVAGLYRSFDGFKEGIRLASTFFRLAPGTVLRLGLPMLTNKIRAVAGRGLRVFRGEPSGPPGPQPRVGEVRFGDLRRLEPVSRHFGYDRGLPVDRHYIESFLGRRAADIHGRVLEVGGNDYTIRFGAARVTASDVLHVKTGNPRATYVADLADAPNLPSDAFDCVVLTQTLHLIYEVEQALATLHRILRPGGVLLMTVPGTISQIERGTWTDTWHWGFTALSIRKLCEAQFPPENLEVTVHGNVLVSIAFLTGIAAEELRPEELTFHDPLYPLLITVRARKSESPGEFRRSP